MRHVRTIRTLALLSVGIAALSVGACSQSGASQNGAYVAASTDSSLPAADQSLPPSNQYQAVADTPPPPLPVYDQPPIPASGYVWTPGYWDWSDDAGDYYWVPGTWVEPPDTGLLWTPGYWRFYNGRYLFSDGYWGPQVGFYGGVDYGYGYGGTGYGGGHWQGNQFFYNSAVNNFGSRRIAATYSQGLPQNGNRVSFNGGPGGLRTAPAQAEIAAAQARHAPPTAGQRDQVRTASAQPQLRASVNRGSPPIAATSRPAAFGAAAGVTAARSAANYTPPPRSGPPPQSPRPGIAGSPAPSHADQMAGRPPTAMNGMPNERSERPAPTERPAAAVSGRPQAAAPQHMREAAPARPPQEIRAGAPTGAGQPAHPPQPREAAPKAAQRPAAPRAQSDSDRPR